jgi:hypothetical protein
MKKVIFFFLAIISFLGIMAQETTLNANYYKVKMGHRNQLYKAMAEHNAKYRQAGSSYAVVAYNLVGGEHHNEVLLLNNIGKSFKDRDQMPPIPVGAQDDLYNTVHPHIEAITGGDLMVYKKEYSNSAFNDRSEKSMTTVYYLKFNVGSDFWDIVKKLPKVWDKAGMKVAGYVPTTGSTRLILTRRMPNGWSELDENKSLAKAYDEVYGIGSYEKDIQIFRAGVERKDATLMTMSKDMSSK